MHEYNPERYSLRNNGNSCGKSANVEYMGLKVFSDIKMKSAPCTDWIPD